MEVAGRTDADITRGMLVTAGVSAERIDERADDVRIAACEAYARLCPDDLSALRRARHRRAARAPRRARGHDPQPRDRQLRADRAAASSAPPASAATSRAGRAASAPTTSRAPSCRRSRGGGRAPAADGEPWPRERTLLIGDTPRDIACARADGVRVVAIATGPFEASALTRRRRRRARRARARRAARRAHGAGGLSGAERARIAGATATAHARARPDGVPRPRMATLGA